MIKSMTGYGCGESLSRSGLFKVEIKTVNNKFFDMSAKLPNGLFVFEDKIREYVQKKIKRGRVHLSVAYENTSKRAKRVTLNQELAASLLREIKKLKKEQDLKGDIDVNQIVSFPGLLTFSDSISDVNRLWSNIKDALDKAILHLDKSRTREGYNLAKDLHRRLKIIKTHIIFITKRADVNVKNYKKDFARRIKELSGGIEMDKGRLEQEVAIYAKNCDITEELTRINSHLVNFNKFLSLEGERGKMLDFMAQELMREANTIGAKSSDFHISNHAIKIKSEIEKIREQVKNIE
ncbi:MAG: YicC family protein [Candidatus Omnitrophica bacterium]|nr:YicC family protein [Candidatus Omnitrophota bacterium]